MSEDPPIRTWKTGNGDTVEIYVGEDGDYHWRVQAPNGEPVGGGEGHPWLSDALAAAKRHHPPVTSGA